ncbi:MAG: hypothetical protein JXR37_28050 [Kiritimatiellae bacterium]|nr:hypothetical protein [Kiritimatiellia bacterium]
MRTRVLLSTLAVLFAHTARGAAPAGPAVKLVLERGASLELPFPRTCDFRADIVPAKGRTIRKIEWDWAGNSEYGRPTPWDEPEPLTVRWAHDFDEETGPVTVRIRVTDSEGGVGLGECRFTLPAGPGNLTPHTRHPCAGIYTQWDWTTWFKERKGQIPDWVAGAEAYTVWNKIEKDGRFAWGKADGSDPLSFNGHIYQIMDRGKHVILHINTMHPAWLFKYVGKSKKPGPHRYPHYPMWWDPRYQQLMGRFIGEYADNIRSLIARHPEWRGRFALVRGQVWTVDSENIPSMGRDLVTVCRQWPEKAMDLTPANFEPPSGGGRVYNAPYSPEHGMPYHCWVRHTYASAFLPLGIPVVFKPHVGGRFGGDNRRMSVVWRRSVANGRELGFFITSATPDTRNNSDFLGYTDLGLARGHHEGHGDSNVNGSAQKTYWTFLSELNTGTDFLGTYGRFIHYLEYQAEYEPAPNHAFANRHVGWKPHPAQAPGAWIALKPKTHFNKGWEKVGNYQAFLEEDTTDAGSHVENVGTVRYTYTGPSDLGHPPTADEPMRWARQCRAGGELRFRLDPRLRKAHGTAFEVRVVYYDDKPGQWTLAYRDCTGAEKTVPVAKKGTGKWCKAILAIADAGFRAGMTNDTDFALRADAGGQTTFHLVELLPTK